MSSIAEDETTRNVGVSNDRDALFERLRSAPFDDDGSEEGADHAQDPVDRAFDPSVRPHAAPRLTAPDVIYEERPAVATLHLDFPFLMEGQGAVTIVKFGLPTFLDFKAAAAGEITELEMHARMAGLPVAAFHAMRWSDVERAVAIARAIAPEIGGG